MDPGEFLGGSFIHFCPVFMLSWSVCVCWVCQTLSLGQHHQFCAPGNVPRAEPWMLCASLAAFSLTCFTCKDASSNLQCLSTTTCSDHEKYCLTTYSTTGLGKCAACPRVLMTNGDRVRLTAGCPPTRRCGRKIRDHGMQRKSCGKWELNVAHLCRNISQQYHTYY